MIKGIKVLILLMLALPTNGLSQELSHQVLVPAAGLAVAGSVSYSQTIGETAVEIFSTSDHVLTQGFQQPGMKISIDYNKGTGVEVFPNPARDYIDVKLFGETVRKFRIDIINIAGVKIRTEQIGFTDAYNYVMRINIENLIRGFYLVRVTSEDGFIDRTFKIEKL
jgi:hypothetical protein